MTRQEYMAKLTAYLSNLPADELDDLLVYYQELFDEADIGLQDKVPGTFKKPQAVALEVLSEVHLQQSNDIPAGQKKRNWALIILLAVLAIPFGLPFLIAPLLLLTSLILSVGAAFIALVAMAIGPLIIIVTSPGGLKLANLIFLIGLSCVGIALLMLIGPLVPQVIRPIISWISHKVIRRKEAGDEV